MLGVPMAVTWPCSGAHVVGVRDEMGPEPSSLCAPFLLSLDSTFSRFFPPSLQPCCVFALVCDHQQSKGNWMVIQPFPGTLIFAHYGLAPSQLPLRSSGGFVPSPASLVLPPPPSARAQVSRDVPWGDGVAKAAPTLWP